MIISIELKEPLGRIIYKINNQKNNVQSIALVHGSSSSLDKKFYVSDIDVEYWLRYQDNKKDLYLVFQNTIDLLLDNKMYFSSFIAGEDDRFSFNFTIRKDGSLKGYDYKEITKRISDLNKNKVITKSQKEEILRHAKEEMDIVSFNKFELDLNKYKKIKWTLEELQKGEKIHFGRKFLLYNFFMKSVFLTNFIFEYSPGKYVPFEIVFTIFKLPETYVNLRPPPGVRQYDLLIDKTYIYGDKSGDMDGRTTYFFYESIFRNYVKERYLKVLKRLGSLLSEVYFKPHFVNSINHNMNKELKNPKNRKLIFYIRNEIKKISKRPEVSCLNQIGSRIDSVIVLSKYKEELEIKRLLVEIINDSKEVCGYFPYNIREIYETLKNYNTETLINELEEFGKLVQDKLNSIAIPYLQKYLDELKLLLPFTIKVPIK